MAEIFSGVYDIMHPTPVSLEELAAMTVSLEIWRCEINKHRKSNTLSDFRPSCDCISLETMFPDLPSPITNVIQEYVTRFALSLKRWLTIHFVKVYHMYYYETQILSGFDDFVFDYNGTIHYERTAKRIMDSDTFSQAVKFEVACTYFFEDDIRRLWPSVCGKVDSMYKHITADETPELLYWICRLTFQFEIMSTIQVNDIYEAMLGRCMTNYYSRQSVEYFWDRIPSERRMRKAMSSFHQTKSFARFILLKLDKQQLAEFINEKGVVMMVLLLRDRSHDETFVLSTWMYIKNIMNVSQITDLVVNMLRSDVEDLKDWRIENRLHLYFEILNNLPLNLKLSISRTILSNNNNVLVESIHAGSGSGWWRTYKFLLGILSCVTVEERNVFWHNYWHLLILRTRYKDLKRIMDICFENEDEIAQFKENIMAGNGTVRDVCVFLLGERFFDELNGLVSFCYPDTGKARCFKQWLLQSVLVGESYCSGIEYLSVSEDFNEFVDDSYENADLSTDFKNKFMSLPAIVQCRSSLLEIKPGDSEPLDLPEILHNG